jgi:hypothetical protein
MAAIPHRNKIGVCPGDEANELIFRRETAVPWSDGEAGRKHADRSEVHLGPVSVHRFTAVEAGAERE